MLAGLARNESQKKEEKMSTGNVRPQRRRPYQSGVTLAMTAGHHHIRTVVTHVNVVLVGVKLTQMMSQKCPVKLARSIFSPCKSSISFEWV